MHSGDFHPIFEQENNQESHKDEKARSDKYEKEAFVDWALDFAFESQSTKLFKILVTEILKKPTKLVM